MRPEPSGRLSVQARRVLEALARTGDGQLTAREVLGHVRQPGTSLAVTRASVSRTLRRLWRAGYVELTDEHGITLTGRCSRAALAAAECAAAPPVGAAKLGFRVGARRANAPMFAGSGEARAAPTSWPRSVSIAAQHKLRQQERTSW
jgi:hypothetical protein